MWPRMRLGALTPTLRNGGAPNGISNRDLSWEKSAQFDAGIDASFLGNRIQLTADYYIKNTSELLFNVNVSVSTGYTNSLRNIGKVENRGVELALNTVNVNQGQFRWNTELNMAYNQNKILALDGRPEFTAGDGIGSIQITNPVLLKVGSPIGNFYGRVVDGIFQNQAEVDASPRKQQNPVIFASKTSITMG